MISALGRPPTDVRLHYLFIAVGYVLGTSGRRLASRGQHWMVVTAVFVLQAVGIGGAEAFVSLGLLHPIWISPIAVHFFRPGFVHAEHHGHGGKPGARARRRRL